jgi:hypothetical protein
MDEHIDMVDEVVNHTEYGNVTSNIFPCAIFEFGSGI